MKLASDKASEWIAEAVPQNTLTPTLWRCKRGHVREASYVSVRSTKTPSGCLVCWHEALRLHPKDYHNLALSKNIKWCEKLSPKTISSSTWWQCPSCERRWQATYRTIRDGSGCSLCHHYKRENDYRVLAASRGFVWADTLLPQSVNHKTNWQCELCKQKWAAAYNSIQQGSGCPTCYESKGEKAVRQTLKMLGIRYEAQATFGVCKSKQVLPFDFSFTLCYAGAVHNFLVEYDGEQHYRAIDFYGGSNALHRTQRHDKIKTAFAEKHDFVLIRIPYTVPLENISTYLIDAVALATGKSFGEIATMGKEKKRKHESLLKGIDWPQGAAIQLPLLATGD